MTLDKLSGITLEHINPAPVAIARLPGFRTLTRKPGHHQTMLQSLVKTVGIDTERLIMLDALRKQRNVADYSGDLVKDAAVAECISQARQLLAQRVICCLSHNPALIYASLCLGISF